MNANFHSWQIAVVILLTGVCLSLSSVALAADSVTFAKDVAPILQEKCQECHHTGSMAPMSLATYEEARPWAKAIRERVITRQMPPWHIDPTVGVQKFKNDMSLSQAQVDTIVRSVDGGAPLGDLKDMPRPRQWPNADEWKATKELGPPDLIVKSEAWTMPAHHQDVWWRPATEIGLTEPRWVRAVEMRPGSIAGRKITHHAVAYLAQEDPDSVVPGSTDDLRGRALLMEWAIGKGYDLYRQGYWQAAAAGIQDLVGYSLSRYRRGPIKGRYVQEKNLIWSLFAPLIVFSISMDARAQARGQGRSAPSNMPGT